MKKALLSVAALAAVSSASAADYVGGSVSIKNGVGGLNLHYQQDVSAASAMRYSLDLDALNVGSNGLSIGGSVDYLTDMPATTATPFSPYYGLGLGAGAYLGNNASAFVIYPHGVLGTKFAVSNPLGLFLEGNAGPAVVVAGGQPSVNFGWGARFGVNYRLN